MVRESARARREREADEDRKKAIDELTAALDRQNKRLEAREAVVAKAQALLVKNSQHLTTREADYDCRMRAASETQSELNEQQRAINDRAEALATGEKAHKLGQAMIDLRRLELETDMEIQGKLMRNSPRPWSFGYPFRC